MPRPFRYRLQKVLDYRGQLEEEAKLALARAIAEHKAQQDAVADLEARLRSHMDRGFGQEATAGDIWLWRSYREALEQDLIMARAELARLALKLQKCRMDAVARSRDRKLLDKLKEQQAKKHHDQESLSEQKEYDEAATVRHERQDL